jgi:HD superfamily phosphohydrolase
MSDIIQALTGRFYMYDSVYFHKVVFSAGILVEKMIEHSYKALNLRQQTENLSEFVWLNDSTLVGAVMSSTSPELEQARKYCKMFLMRQLPTLIKEYTVPADNKYSEQYYHDLHKGDNIIVSKTRVLTGMTASAFDDLNIYFWEKSTKSSLTCVQALKKCVHFSPGKPYYIVRIYKL